MKLRPYRYIISLILVLGLWACTSPAEEAFDRDLANQLRAALDYTVKNPKTKFPGVVLYVSSPDLGTWTGASGLSNKETASPMKPGDKFRAGSVIKPLVAVVPLQLIEEGKFSLDDPMPVVLPEKIYSKFSDSDKITVRMLLNHTSGIADWVTQAVVREITADPQKIWKDEEFLDIAAEQGPHFAPGEGQAYSNTDYTLLGLVIEQAMGCSWREEVRNRIIVLLKLNNTVLPEPGDVSIPAGHAHGYHPISQQLVDVTQVDPSMAGAAGGHALETTAADLGRFLKAVMKGELFQHTETLNAMLSFVDWPKGNPLSRVIAGYGLGLMKAPFLNGIEGVGHSGDTAGFHAFVFYLPAHGITISGSVNYPDYLAFSRLIPSVLEILLRE